MKISMTILAASVLLASAPLVAADETNPDCEADQQWIGYDEQEANTATIGALAPLYVCEGEHWDGQDTVRGGESATSDCLTAVNVDPSGNVDLCMGADPNQGEADPIDGASPVALRVSTSGSQVYTGANIFSVGRAVVYTDGSGMVAVYLRDNTPTNLLAQAISAPGITQGTPGDADCDQETYAEGANTNNRDLCTRDNTAITVNILA